MFDNRVVQLFYRTIFIVFSFIGCVDSIYNLFLGTFDIGALKYYTNLSNYVCFVVMLIVLIFNLKQVLRNEIKGHNEKFVRFKFLSTILILVTFLVYNFVLLPTTDSNTNYFLLDNLTMHFICPVMFVLDFFLFDKHHTVKKKDIFLCTIMPLIYVILVLIIGATTKNFVYPYFFLDPTKSGYLGVFLWVLGLVVFFVLLAFLFFLYDKIVKNENNKYVLDLKGKYKKEK